MHIVRRRPCVCCYLCVVSLEASSSVTTWCAAITCLSCADLVRSDVWRAARLDLSCFDGSRMDVVANFWRSCAEGLS